MSDEFKVLTDAEHILLRSGMYLGSMSCDPVFGFFEGEWKTINVVPAFLKIIDEIIDNSVDEFVRTKGKFANKIDVTFKEGLEGFCVTIRDNGRGIPQDEIGGVPRPVIAWSKARAGSNFTADRETMGANGVGSFATAVFSNQFYGKTKTANKELVVHISNNAKDVEWSHILGASDDHFTEVSFYPDLVRFGIEEVGEEYFTITRTRLQNLCLVYPGIEFTFNGTKIKCDLKKYYKDIFSEADHHETSGMFGNVAIGPVSDNGARFHSYVNGLYTYNGGVHIDWYINRIIEHLRPLLEKKFKIELKPDHIRQKLCFVGHLKGFKNLMFSSQTKDRITNPVSDVETFYDITEASFSKMARKIFDIPAIVDPIVQEQLLRKQMAENAAIARAAKKGKKEKIANHITATSKTPSEKSLFIAEGLSAIGPLISVRDPAKVGGYSLRGKVMNVSGMNPVDIIKNKEYRELMSVIGLEFGKEPVLNYGKIIIMTDADPDGHSIACMLVNFLSMWPSLFDGHVFRCMSPLLIAKKGKQEKWFYDLKDVNGVDGWEHNYIKGLGSLDEEAYNVVINQPKLVELRMDSDDDKRMLNMAFADGSDGRKKWLMS